MRNPQPKVDLDTTQRNLQRLGLEFAAERLHVHQ
jgi:hypothetical protein